jgi:S1-C subfamily serine protease
VNKTAGKKQPTDGRRTKVLIGVGAAAALGGIILGRWWFAPGPEQVSQPRRPIVQIVRPLAGLPSLSDTIARICPSIASIVPGRMAEAANAPSPSEVPAFVVSADGWLVTTASIEAAGQMHAVFGDGRQAAISEVRIDPISGLAIAKSDASGLAPVEMVDQAFPRIGDFGFSLQSPSGNGCTSAVAMISGDFLADGGGPVSYVRASLAPGSLPAGVPFLNGDGQTVAVAIADPAVPDAMLPAAIAGIVVDELIRGSPSPSIAFGFRATDFSSGVAARVSNARLRGAGVALVQPGSAADKAGLHAGDVVVAVGNSPVSSASELGRSLDAATDKASLTIMRDDRRMTVTIPRSNGGH